MSPFTTHLAGVLFGFAMTTGCASRRPPAAPTLDGWGRLAEARGENWVVADMPRAETLPRRTGLLVVTASGQTVGIVEVVSEQPTWKDHVEVTPVCTVSDLSVDLRVGEMHPERISRIGKCLAKVVMDRDTPVVQQRDWGTGLLLDVGSGNGVEMGDVFAILGEPRVRPGQAIVFEGWTSMGTCRIVSLDPLQPSQSWCHVESVPQGGLGGARYLRWVPEG